MGKGKEKITKETVVVIRYDASKLKAIRQYMSRKNLELEDEIKEHFNQVYLRFVPQAVRDFISFQDEDEDETLSEP